jgi:hypothetical protein
MRFARASKKRKCMSELIKRELIKSTAEEEWGGANERTREEGECEREREKKSNVIKSTNKND